MNYDPTKGLGKGSGASRMVPEATADDGGEPHHGGDASPDDAGASEDMGPVEAAQTASPYAPLVEACRDALAGDFFNAEGTAVRRTIRGCLLDLGELDSFEPAAE